ncbi:hypothetical protein CAPN001_24600 [Capnocytophaga stomatis]|nr:hypothetical protein CAPN001_24600 [Capnocytophaga stomatis]
MEDFDRTLYNYTFLRNIYKTMPISYQTMQRLLSGRIKRQKDLKSAYDEVTMLYKEVEDCILIDAFFINTKNDKL